MGVKGWGNDKPETSRDRFRGCLLGLACGDAVGTTVEFMPRGTFPPVTDMIGGGPFGLQYGEWTGDQPRHIEESGAADLAQGAALAERLKRI